MLKNIKVWDKIVYSRYAKKEFILVESIEDFEETRTIKKEIDWKIVEKEVKTWEKTTLINGKYSIKWPLRAPTPLELEAWEFIWIKK